MTVVWLCVDGVKTWLQCNVLDGNGTGQPAPMTGLVTFNPVFGGGDSVLSFAGGVPTFQPKGTHGTAEVFLIQGDFALITPSQPNPLTPQTPVYGLKWLAAS